MSSHSQTFKTFILSYFRKMSGSSPPSSKVSLIELVISGLGCFLAMSLLTLFSDGEEYPFLIASFGATSILLFAFPLAPFSQPRSVIGGHIIGSAMGLSMVEIFHSQAWWVIALALSLTIFFMLITRTIHPPAGGDPIIVILNQSGWSFLFQPILISCLALVILALLYNNLFKSRKYPQFWL